jgi:hypothetical protein
MAIARDVNRAAHTAHVGAKNRVIVSRRAPLAGDDRPVGLA